MTQAEDSGVKYTLEVITKGAPAIECQTYTQLVSPAEGPKKKIWRSQQLQPKITVEPHIDLS